MAYRSPLASNRTSRRKGQPRAGTPSPYLSGKAGAPSHHIPRRTARGPAPSWRTLRPPRSNGGAYHGWFRAKPAWVPEERQVPGPRRRTTHALALLLLRRLASFCTAIALLEGTPATGSAQGTRTLREASERRWSENWPTNVGRILADQRNP